jgi:hypothetical protein
MAVSRARRRTGILEIAPDDSTDNGELNIHGRQIGSGEYQAAEQS